MLNYHVCLLNQAPSLTSAAQTPPFPRPGRALVGCHGARGTMLLRGKRDGGGGHRSHCRLSMISIICLVGGFKHDFYFPFHIWGVILPIDEFIFFQRGRSTTNPVVIFGWIVTSLWRHWNDGYGLDVRNHCQMAPPKCSIFSSAI